MTYAELAKHCRAWRLGAAVTQKQIAETADTSVQAVCQFEAGRCNSLRIYCAYLSHGFRLEDRTDAFEAMSGEVFASGKTET
jgi:DNA-binding XRE family transcriptional regulator